MGAILRAGIIGDTGRGDYGHSLDIAYKNSPDVEVVSIADPDNNGRKAAAQRSGASREYDDYREMLDKENLDLVNVCPRWLGNHEEMVIASATAEVKGILCEKPFAPSLSEADSMLESCARNGVRVVVAHRRVNAYEIHGKKLLDDGLIGDLRTIKSRGKEDRRAGSMDLMVLGTHMMDSLRYFAGDEVEWVHGSVTQNNHAVTVDDIYEGNEEIGLIAGNGVDAHFKFQNGISAYFESHPSDPGSDRHSRSFGFEIHGTTGVISIRNSPSGEMYIYPHGQWIPSESDGKWERIYIENWERMPDGTVRNSNERTHLSNHMMVTELINAIREDREVEGVSSGEDGRKALEMIMAVHESERLKTRVYLPMVNRENPYSTWRQDEYGF